MINIEALRTDKESIPMTYETFEHHMNHVIDLYNHTKTLNALYESDPMYFGSSIDPVPSINHIISLLSNIFKLPNLIPEDKITILSVWVYSLDCGNNCYPGCYIDKEANLSDAAHRAPDLSTLPDLYDYIIYVYNREKGVANET